MQKIILYRYVRSDGGVTVSPVNPECEYTKMFRLIADEGCILTDGGATARCIDTNSPEAWAETEDLYPENINVQY